MSQLSAQQTRSVKVSLFKTIAVSVTLGSMFERFDEQARRALFFARYEVSALGSASIDTGHLLLALLSDAKGAVHAMLSAQNITYADVRQHIRPEPIERRRAVSEEVPFSQDTKRALNRAAVEADALRHTHIGCEHLLIALLHDKTSQAGSIASAHGLTAEAALADLRRFLNEPADTPLSLPLPLPPLPKPAGNYVHAVRVGDLMFLAGKGARDTIGKVGRDLSVEQAYQIARATGMILLSALAAELGSLDRVVRIVKVTGFVNAAPEFAEHPKVIDGCSDLFVEVLGARGRHARSAIGVASLPNQIPIEIEAVVEVRR
jgi:enamine deaminase RidA (YjgF/YER057c/UK114 family)